MLSLQHVSLRLGSEDDAPVLLSDVTGDFCRGDFVAIIGPSGCGKSTLLKMISGIATGEEEGMIRWDGRNLAEDDFKPSEFGYVPQFSIAYDELTVAECVDYSARLRVAGLSASEREAMVERLLGEVGMSEFHDRRVKVLSGGQKRRLALAMELVSSPPILLCDEVTSGLDPQAEEEIVSLLRRVAREGNRLVLSVTHSLKHLVSYDAVMVLYKGVLAYEGMPEFAAHYFRVEDPNLIYGQLETREPGEWQNSWKKHGSAFTKSVEGEEVVSWSGNIDESSVSGLRLMPGVIAPDGKKPAEVLTCAECGTPSASDLRYCRECGARLVSKSAPQEGNGIAPAFSVIHEDGEKKEKDSVKAPGPFSQFITLVDRRFRIFFRSHAQLWLQAGLVFGFPCIVALFGWNGLPQIRNLSMGLDQNAIQQQQEALGFLQQASTVGSLVSGIVMFEVILLTLMGANNSGREIAAERPIFEKEKLSGLSIGAYVGSKVLFLGILSAVQSLWMGLFIHVTCAFPGELGGQLLFLFLVNAAMTSICLAISSFMATAEQASLASIYLVGFQLPLSGAVLALPVWLGGWVKYFIAAYWSWSGILQTLRSERYYDIVTMVAQTALSGATLCFWVLGIHLILGVVMTFQGCGRTRME